MPLEAPPATLILSTADWNRPLWTNKQHLASSLAQRLPRLWYVDSLGLRKPSLKADDFHRILRRLGGQRRTTQGGERRPPQNVEVITPKVLPFHPPRWPTGRFNDRALLSATKSWSGAPRAQRILWTFSPIAYSLPSLATRTVYHCVDLLHEFPGIDHAAVRAGERELSRVADVAIGSSVVVCEHLVSAGFRDIRLWENVADAALIIEESSSQDRFGDRVGFVGNLTPHKIDLRLFFEILAADQRIVVEVAGPTAEGGGRFDALARLAAHPRVRMHGVLQPRQMAQMLGRCSVGVIPYLVNSYTKGVFPMKVYEYMAAGLRVISTPLPSLTPSVDLVVARPGDFGPCVARCTGLPTTDDIARRRGLASEHSWARRADQAVSLITELLASGEPSCSNRLPKRLA